MYVLPESTVRIRKEMIKAVRFAAISRRRSIMDFKVGGEEGLQLQPWDDHQQKPANLSEQLLL